MLFEKKRFANRESSKCLLSQLSFHSVHVFSFLPLLDMTTGFTTKHNTFNSSTAVSRQSMVFPRNIEFRMKTIQTKPNKLSVSPLKWQTLRITIISYLYCSEKYSFLSPLLSHFAHNFSFFPKLRSERNIPRFDSEDLKRGKKYKCVCDVLHTFLRP